MQRLRTNATLMLFIFGASLIAAAPSVDTAAKIDFSANSLQIKFHNVRNVVSISDITSRTEDDEKNALITYQPINHDSETISDANDDMLVGDSRLYDVKATGFDGTDANPIHLISTLSKDSCGENLTLLPAWKIDKHTSEGKFRLKINHAKELPGVTLFLCVFDDTTGQFWHLGDNSRLHVDG